MDRNRYDAAIAGAGLTGQLMALALAHEGFSVALIDPAGAAPLPENDHRTTALAYASVRMFARLGLWEPLAENAGTIHDILVSNGHPGDRFRQGGLSGGKLHFPASLLPVERAGPDGTPLGHIVRNADMLELFRERIAENGLIDVINSIITSPRNESAAVHLGLENGRELTSSVLIACDGKQSSLRDRMGFRTQSWSYGQKALAFNIRHEKPHHGVAHEIFYPEGPFAILPMNGNECSIVWTEKDPKADAYLALSKEDFLKAVQDRVGSMLGAIELSSPPASFPLSFVYVNEPVRERTVLAGDAYHGIHPIAGQGFNLGIKDIAVMADIAADAAAHGLDIGAANVLEKYTKWRRFDAASLAFGTDALTRLFSNDIAPVRWARGLGLGLVQRFDPARIFSMRQAGADTGDLPRLMQPF